VNKLQSGSLYDRPFLAFDAPAVDLFDIETPVAADLERRQLPRSE
jgi:hypothetical protein